MAFIVKGDKELSARFEEFPTVAHTRLGQAIRALTDELYARVLSSTPFKTGKLKSEDTERVFIDDPKRVAGYVSVYAGADSNEYAKAAALEYGSNRGRKVYDKGGAMEKLRNGKLRRLAVGTTKPVHLAAYAYLRGPLADMQGQVQAELEAAIAQAIADSEQGAV